MKNLFGIAIIAMICLFSCSTSHASRGRESLKDISWFVVSINTSLDSSLEQMNFPTDNIKTDVELRLRKAGVMIKDTAKDPATFPQSAILQISITGIDIKTGMFAFNMNVEVIQGVYLYNSKMDAAATTWGNGALVVWSEKTAFKSLRENIADYVDEFINDYLAANPE